MQSDQQNNNHMDMTFTKTLGDRPTLIGEYLCSQLQWAASATATYGKVSDKFYTPIGYALEQHIKRADCINWARRCTIICNVVLKHVTADTVNRKCADTVCIRLYNIMLELCTKYGCQDMCARIENKIV